MPDVERALIAYPMDSANVQADRGAVLACTRLGRIERLLVEGMPPPQRYARHGIVVWEGRVFIDPEPMPDKAKPRDGVWFEGIWRQLTDAEWAAVRNGVQPWAHQDDVDQKAS